MSCVSFISFLFIFVILILSSLLFGFLLTLSRINIKLNVFTVRFLFRIECFFQFGLLSIDLLVNDFASMQLFQVLNHVLFHWEGTLAHNFNDVSQI